ncbi:MAG: fibronectin type III domain-containing protein [Bacteroidales bacterium]|nr:fibronectin type III domain-containing protein [Bacteroidales bacterium]
MKRIYRTTLLVVASLLPMISMAQSVVDYTMTTGASRDKWKTLTSSATVCQWTKYSSSNIDDNATSVLTLPFGFKLGGTTYNNFSVSINGRMGLGSTLIETSTGLAFTPGNAGTFAPCIAPFACDLKLYTSGSSTSRSYVKYQTFGSSPNRTFVVEWRTGRYYRGSAIDTVNFQVQLDEGTNVVRFVYGRSYSGDLSPYQAGISTSAGDVLTIDPSSFVLIKAPTSSTFDLWPGEYRYFELTPGSVPACPSMILRASASVQSSNRASITWEASASSSSPTYNVKLKNNNTGSVKNFTETSTTKSFNTLEPTTPYTVEISSTCNPSQVLSVDFSTRCMETRDIIPTATTSGEDSYIGPVNNYYRYSMTQSIFLNSEVGTVAFPIKTISIAYIDSVNIPVSRFHEMTAKNNVSIYMGHTTKTKFDVIDDRIDFSSMQKVYQGDLNCTQSGWNDFELSVPFNYDGHSNLVVAIIDSSRAYDCDSKHYHFGRSATTEKRFFHSYTDQSTIDLNSPQNATLLEKRPTMRFMSCFAPCTAPTLSISGIATSSADFSWTATSCASTAYSNYEIEYGPAGFNHGEGTSQQVDGSTTATITGLQDGVDYKAYVRVVDASGNAKSEWSNAVDFSTNPCGIPQNVAKQNETENTVTITWTAGLNGTGMYEVEYGPQGFTHGNGTTKTVGATNTQLNGLQADVVYMAYVRTQCGSDSYSAWSAPVYIHGENAIDIATMENAISIYPNPTSAEATIAVSGLEGNVQMTLIDLNGRTIRAASWNCAGDCTETLNVEGLAKGIYFVRLSSDNTNVVKKLVVK